MWILKSLATLYSPSIAKTLVYMLQSTEYEAVPYLKWYWRTKDFSSVSKRRQLENTGPARKLKQLVLVGLMSQYAVAFALCIYGVTAKDLVLILLGAAVAVIAPILWAHLVILPMSLARILIVNPSNARRISASREIFHNHRGTVIAVAGSYGKTSMKELLLTVLSEGKRVAATPANKNVAISHAIFAEKLRGDEDALIIEYGEGKPGDVEKFADTTDPDIGIITGVAPAHLDKYSDLDAAARDIFALSDYLGDKPVYVNGSSDDAKPYSKKGHLAYTADSVADWKISDIEVTISGLSFTMKQGKKQLHLKSGLLGRHQVGPLAAVAAIADSLGLSSKQIETGIAKTKPFEHRMQPYQLNGAWIIDDTYNGNIEGLRCGLALLRELPATRKIYITPGLVDQGVETENVHRELGKAIAENSPDEVVLMRNSVTEYIEAGIENGGYKGKITLVSDPLDFYTNISSYVAAGDLVMMQNDWTDNYA